MLIYEKEYIFLQLLSDRDMAGIVINKDTSVISCGLQILIIRGGSERILDIPVPVSKTSDTHVENGSAGGQKETGQELQGGAAVAAVALSPAGDKVAVCDDRKQVCVIRLSDLRDASNIST